MMNEWLMLGLIVAVTLIPSLLIGAITARSISTWYVDLRKPRWNPPNWIFGPVWTVLYICMSVAYWLVWKNDPNSVWPLRLYVGQLLLNHAWSPTFFLLKRPAWAFAIIVTLWIAVFATTVVFAQSVVAAGKLMVPYLLWVSYAASLNFRIWQDNRVPAAV